MTFEQLDLLPSIRKALQEEGYEKPTDIQAQAIPFILDGQDVLGSAQTGTGKTAAFAIPIIQHLLLDHPPQKGKVKIKTLVVTPTRELAIQIGDSFSTYGKYTHIKNAVVFGGVTQGSQTNALKRGVDVVVATPGRLLDLINQGYLSLKDIEYFVLDEADRMLDMGFIHDIRKIIALLPKKRQSLFFSATMPKSIVSLANQILNNPQKVAVSPVSSTAETIQQFVYFTNKPEKRKLLLHILEDSSLDQVLLFSRTKRGADRIVRDLRKKNIHAAAIHGDKTQVQRQKALQSFKDGEVRVLVATDIAARGIDIDKLNYVINYDIPNEPETYVHRIGRCGRAGEDGVSISLCEPEENAYLKAIEKLTNQSVEVIKDNPFPQTDKPMNTSEKKEAAKQKEKNRQAFFANRKKKGGKKQGSPRRQKR